MKKIIIVLALAAIIATGNAFADHPDGFGIGVVGRYGINYGGYGGALSLKIPNIPIYWGINLGFGTGYFGFGLTGDSYLIDNQLTNTLHWFFGVGGFIDVQLWDKAIYLGFGGRVPIGLSWQPVDLLEIFIDVAPSLGFGLYTDKNYGGGGFIWGVPVEIGLRLWF